MTPLNQFVTPRLTATRLTEHHFAELCRMHSDPVVMATLAGCKTDEQTRELLEANLAHWDNNDFGLWVLRDRIDGQFAGRGGLRRVMANGQPEVEVAYALMSEFWGRGLATEFAAACVAIAREHLGLEQLVCFTLPTNQASQRVMQKVGFQFEQDGTHASLPHVFYRITTERMQEHVAAECYRLDC